MEKTLEIESRIRDMSLIFRPRIVSFFKEISQKNEFVNYFN